MASLGIFFLRVVQKQMSCVVATGDLSLLNLFLTPYICMLWLFYAEGLAVKP